MNLQQQSLRQFFERLVAECYGTRMGIDDPEISAYITNLLTDFSRSDRLYSIRGASGDPLREISAMAAASDPVHGAAASFGEERELRKHIGDYALFLTGMYPDSSHNSRRSQGNSFHELVDAGKESYYIVSQFDLFEFAAEAPFFARMAERFEECMRGLNLVRGEIDHLRAIGSGSAYTGNADPPRCAG